MKRLILLSLLVLLASTVLASTTIIKKKSGGSGYATPSYVNSASIYTGTCSTNASVSATAGNILVLSVSGTGTQVLSGAATYTGTTSAWTHVGTVTGGDVDISFYWASVSTTGTVAARPSCTTNGDAGYVLTQYSGIDTTSPIIGTIQGDGFAAAAAFSTANITTTTPAMLVGMWGNETEDKTVTYGSGWTQRVNQTDHIHKTADKATTTSGDYNFSGSWTGNTSFMAGFIALKAAAL